MPTDHLGYYADLGVSSTASLDDIKAVFRALAKIYHPDINQDPAAAERFKRVSLAYEILTDADKRGQYDASLPEPEPEPPPPEPAEPPVLPVLCSVCGEVTAQPRALTFRRVVGLGFTSRVTPVSGIFCKNCAARAALRQSAVTAVLGWWSLPLGPLVTLREMLRNALGGEARPDEDERLIWQNTRAFLAQGRLELALSLAQSLDRARDGLIRRGAQRVVEVLTARGLSSPRLKFAWQARPALVAGQVLMACAVPVAVWAAFSMPLLRTGIDASALIDSAAAAIVPAALEEAPQLCATPPSSGAIVAAGAILDGGHTVRVVNESSADAIVRLRDAATGSATLSLFVAPHSTIAADGIGDGAYRVQFDQGDALDASCAAFVDAHETQFGGVYTLRTRTTGGETVTQEMALTLPEFVRPQPETAGR
jgi:hypothetical protein